MKRFVAIVLLCSVLPLVYGATQDIYSFSTEQQRAQFNRLTLQLRCLVCQNESLADSNAPLAQDLRAEIATLVNQGASDQQINGFLVERYGNFVLFKPPFIKATYLLWSAPFIFIVIGLVVLVTLVKRRRR